MVSGSGPGERPDRRRPDRAAPAGASPDRPSAARVPGGPARRERPSARLRRRLLFAGGVLLAAAVRWPLLPHLSGDAQDWIHWHHFIVANGHFAALEFGFYHYGPPYIYLLTTFALFLPELPPLLAVKAIPLLFEVLLALLVHRTVRLRYPESPGKPLLATLAVLFAPTVLLNGALWGQTDVVPATFLAACLYFLLRERPGAAFAAFGLAFAFKAPAVFFLPALLWIAAKRGPGKAFAPRHLLLAPLVWLVSLLPAWFFGRPLYDLLSIYAAQAGVYRELTKEAANLYQWIPNAWYPLWPLGVAVTVAVVWGVTAAVRRSRAVPTREMLVTLSVFSLVLVPYLLPKMHDRYFFAADVFTILLAFWRPRFWYAPIALGLTSANSYWHGAFNAAAPVVPLAWTAVVPLLLLVVLGRQLARDLGYEVRFDRLGPFVRERFARWRAAALPFALLLLALGGTAFFASEGGRFARSVVSDPIAAGTLARAANRSPANSLAGFSHRTLGEDGAAAYHFGGRAALGGDLALRAATGHFGRDLGAQGRGARWLMAAFFFGAAVLAYGALARLFGRRVVALGAVLSSFAAVWAVAGDVVAVEGAPALFGVFLLFHGLVVFSAEGRFGRLLATGGAAVFLGFAAYALLLPFAALALVAARRPRGEGEEPSGPDGWRRRGFRSPALRLTVCCLAFGGVLLGLGALHERSVLAGDAARVAAPGGGGPLFGEEAVAGSSGEVEEQPRLGAVGRILGGAAGRLGAPLAPRGLPPETAPVLGGLLALAGVIGAARSRRRAHLLPLALSGVFWALATGNGAAAAEVGALAALGPLLVVSSLGFEALRRRFGERALRGAAAAAIGFAPFSGARSAAGGPDAGRDAGTAVREAQVLDDFRQIRGVLRRRGGDGRVFVPQEPFGGAAFAGGRLAAWGLAGNILVTDPERRGDAEFLLLGRRQPRPGLLTAGSQEVHLYHRAAYDGEIGEMIEAAGPPRAQSDFAVHLHGRHLLYVRADCRPEDLEPQVILHLDPEETADLPPHRKEYGFDNLTFRLHDHLYERGARCVLGVRLPDYPIRSVVTGQFRRGEGVFEEVWRVEFPFSEAESPR